MKHDLIIQELKAVQNHLVKLCSSEQPNMAIAHRNDQTLRPSISRLRFVIATLEAKEADTVRLKDWPVSEATKAQEDEACH